MNNLSHYVFETTNQTGQRVLFNTVSRKELPVDATQEQLGEHFFLKGQEKDALISRVTNQKIAALALNIAPTLECNLRCTHCMLTHMLLDHQPNDVDVDKLCNFVERCGVKTIAAFLYGGENFLRVDKCNEIVDRVTAVAKRLDINICFDMVSNLTLDMDERHFNLIDKLQTLGVSVDGLERQHNLQRLTYKSEFNPFQKTLNNLKILIRRGCKKKLLIKCCFGEHDTPLHRRDVARLFLELGLPPEQFQLGYVGPAESQAGSNKYLQDLRKKNDPPQFGQWCCRYRFTNIMTDYTGNIYSDIYHYNKIGTLDDSMETLIKNRTKLILETMPLFTDEKCINCPAVATCWTGCARYDFVGGKSKYCDQEGRYEHLKNMAEMNYLC